jgi:YD repeat-containing protein
MRKQRVRAAAAACLARPDLAVQSAEHSTDASGRVTTYGYAADGNHTSVTLPGGRTSTSTYNATCDLTSTTTPAGKTTTVDYDPHGNLTSVTRTLAVSAQNPVQQTSTFAYDSAGNQTAATDPLHHTTTFEYDNRGNLVSRTDPLGHTTSRTYDNNSRVASITSPRGHEPGADPNDFTTTIVRDALGRPIGTTDASAGTRAPATTRWATPCLRPNVRQEQSHGRRDSRLPHCGSTASRSGIEPAACSRARGRRASPTRPMAREAVRGLMIKRETT